MMTDSKFSGPGMLAVVAAIAICLAVPASACGPYSLVTYFWDHAGADLPLARVADGELAPFEILRPLEAYLAFRWLTDRPLAAEDRDAVVDWRRGDVRASWRDADAPKEKWRRLRASVARDNSGGAPADYRWAAGYHSYRNCLNDAFVVAGRALEVRIARWGGTSREVGEWLAGQDQVFANCGGGEHIPKPLDESWPEDLRFDRAYQIAAALLYSEHWSEAEQHFLAIAAEPLSPWSMISAYVSARAMLRQGRYEDAGEQLRAVIAEPRLEPMHADAERLLRYVRYRTAPAAQHAETRAKLLDDRLPDEFDQIWTDYLWGLGVVPDRSDDLDLFMLALTRPLSAYGAPGEQPRAITVDRWRDKGGRLWRFVALAVAQKGWLPRQDIDNLLAEAAAVPSDAFESAAAEFHRLRLLLDLGRFDAVQEGLGRLRERADKWPLGARNRLRELEVRAAPDLRGLLEAAVAEPAAVSWGGEYDTSFEYVGFDPQAGALLDLGISVLQQLPSATLAELVRTAKLPPVPRRQLLAVAFARALLAGNHAAALLLSPYIEKEVADLSGGSRAYRSAKPEERAFVAALVLLWSPGARPWFDYGVAHSASSPWRSMGWWCSSPGTPPEHNPLPRLRVELEVTWAEFKILHALAPAPEFFAAMVFPWADAHPDDPRVPEALHRLVVTTRHACGQRFGEISKRAFERLHRRYPESPWTAKTPYWFGS